MEKLIPKIEFLQKQSLHLGHKKFLALDTSKILLYFNSGWLMSGTSLMDGMITFVAK